MLDAGHEGLHRLPAALKLIDIRDELQNLGRDGDVLDGVHGAIYPFLPIFTQLLCQREADIHL